MSERTAFLTSDYAAILRSLKMRGQMDELARMLNSYIISDEFVYPIIDREYRRVA
jgi:hypothetical protein